MESLNIAPVIDAYGQVASTPVAGSHEVLGVRAGHRLEVRQEGRKQPVHVIVTGGVEVRAVPIYTRERSSLVFIRVRLTADPHLFLIVHAGDLFGFPFGPRQRWQ